ncbi:MAG: flu 2 [Candidatus Brocadiaceae bacterium]|nr:flu 2 [Candidatus Brocadiaceae bacterium]
MNNRIVLPVVFVILAGVLAVGGAIAVLWATGRPEISEYKDGRVSPSRASYWMDEAQVYPSENHSDNTSRISPLPSEQEKSSPDKAAFMQKAQKLQMPFIANNGQMDEQVRFYAKTLGGTVFVTKDGEIVYSLPEGRVGKDSREQRGGRIEGLGSGGVEGKGRDSFARKASGFTSNTYMPFLHTDSANCPSDHVLAKSLVESYLPKIQNPQTPIRGVALKECLVGGKVDEIKGRVRSVAAVSYFKGNDPAKWKSNIPTYEVVGLGEVYEGVDLSLKAYGNNVEKLFTVKPGAYPEQIRIQLEGVQSPESGRVTVESGFSDGNVFAGKGARGLSVNEQGELVAETALGPVKFTKPVAYQEIEGKRVEVAVEYLVLEWEGSWGAGEQGGGGGLRDQNQKAKVRNPKSEIRNSKLKTRN